MGCICSKDSSDKVDDDAKQDFNKSSVQVIAPSSKRDDIIIRIPDSVNGGIDGKSSSSQVNLVDDHNDKTDIIVERPKTSNHLNHIRWSSIDSSVRGGKEDLSKTMPAGADNEWPSWLTSVASEAIQGWTPRSADSFQKLNKIGQGTYSSVYKARDLNTNKIVALKKVRFVNMDQESVRFMAREIYILRKLDHPNVMKLEGIVTSRMSDSLCLVFEYMEHDLAGLAARPGVKLTEAQIKCYMHQLLRGLEHCHDRGILHRDIKASNLLIDDNGVLKIGDFGLAASIDPKKKQALTSRVVTLWYRAPELLLGATDYGPAIDLWSAGCILAELFAEKPILPGRTEVEQMHKIFKLCGSPTDTYWKKTKFPHATSFKPQNTYECHISEAFRDFPSSALSLTEKLLAIEAEDRGSATSALQTKFFTTNPLPCDPANLPKYPPSKEYEVRVQNWEDKRRKEENVKGRGPVSVVRGRGTINTKALPTPEFNTQRDMVIQRDTNAETSHNYKFHGNGGASFAIEVRGRNGYTHSTSMIHPAASGPSCSRTTSMRKGHEVAMQKPQKYNAAAAAEISSKRDDIASSKEQHTGYVPKKNRIHYSGPLVPLGGNMDDMLKEHERLMQEAFRKARVDRRPSNR